MMWLQPASPASPAKQTTARCIDSPSLCAAEDVAAAAVESYGEVLEELEVTLTDITDDWRKLRNALWLIEHLLACTPQLMDDLCAEPGMLRGLLGFWAEDETGFDCGQEVRQRASALLAQLEAHEQLLLASSRMQQAQQAFQAQQFHGQQAAAGAEAQHCGFGCMVSQPWEEEGVSACSPTASEDSATSACSPLDFSFSSAAAEASPFAGARENSRSRRPGSAGSSGFSLPGLRLPNLRAIKTSAAGSLAKAAAPAARAPVPKALTVPSAKLSTKLSSGRPPLGAGSLRFRSSSLQKGGSYQANASVELVAAWGQIRGQSSTDFARMLQALDDQCFDAAQQEFEMLQQPNGCGAIDAC